ncbi:MAG: hypothetical protein EZS28_050181, partial [Streblomastix strix]
MGINLMNLLRGLRIQLTGVTHLETQIKMDKQIKLRHRVLNQQQIAESIHRIVVLAAQIPKNSAAATASTTTTTTSGKIFPSTQKNHSPTMQFRQFCMADHKIAALHLINPNEGNEQNGDNPDSQNRQLHAMPSLFQNPNLYGAKPLAKNPNLPQQQLQAEKG